MTIMTEAMPCTPCGGTAYCGVCGVCGRDVPGVLGDLCKMNKKEIN
jgi:hypothetical protein